MMNRLLEAISQRQQHSLVSHATFLSLCWLTLVSQPNIAQWEKQAINSQASLRGLSVVSKDIAWVSGTGGTVGRTTDGGQHWQTIIIPGAEKLDIRDIEAFSDSTAYALSIGPGDQSRIYKTKNGGQSWQLQFTNLDKEAFYDAIAFWDEKHGIALSDPVQGKYRMITTNDGGQTWKPLPSDSMPAALPKEGAFAASGTCLITQGSHDAWFVTGGSKYGRVFHTTDRGKSWTVTESPMPAGKESAGIFSVAFKNATEGMLAGGDYATPARTSHTAARSTDAGKSWKLVEQPLPFCSCVIWSQDRWIAVGTRGSFQSSDGLSWKVLDQENYNVVARAVTGEVWAAGPQGRIARLKPR